MVAPESSTQLRCICMQCGEPDGLGLACRRPRDPNGFGFCEACDHVSPEGVRCPCPCYWDTRPEGSEFSCKSGSYNTKKSGAAKAT